MERPVRIDPILSSLFVHLPGSLSTTCAGKSCICMLVPWPKVFCAYPKKLFPWSSIRRRGAVWHGIMQRQPSSGVMANRRGTFSSSSAGILRTPVPLRFRLASTVLERRVCAGVCDFGGMEDLTDIRTNAFPLETLLSVALRSKASDHGSLFDIGLVDLLDQLPSLFFSKISEEVLVNIFSRVEDDPRNLARLACVCVRFARVIRRTVWKRQCLRVVPSVVWDLSEHNASEPLGGWGGLQKLLVCCPGLKLAGVMLEWWDFGLDRELGSSESYRTGKTCRLDEEPAQVKKSQLGTRVTSGSEGTPFVSLAAIAKAASASSPFVEDEPTTPRRANVHPAVQEAEQNDKGARVAGAHEVPCMKGKLGQNNSLAADGEDIHAKPDDDDLISPEERVPGHNEHKLNVSSNQMDLGHGRETYYSSSSEDSRVKKVKRKKRVSNAITEGMTSGACCSHQEPHLACGMWNLTREEGTKLLARRFQADILYVCDWPGCIHPGKRRKYKLFRGMFKNFKSSLIWRNIGDLKSRKTAVPCAFCSSSGTWDMRSTFCLRRSNEYHDDGEPVVRAYVCENGHVAGAWTDRPVGIL